MLIASNRVRARDTRAYIFSTLVHRAMISYLGHSPSLPHQYYTNEWGHEMSGVMSDIRHLTG